MIRRYSAKCKDELLLMMWIDINQDFPVSYFEWLVKESQSHGLPIERILNVLDSTLALWRATT